MTDPLLTSVLRLRTKAKNIAKTQVRNPYRRRKKAIKLTEDERRAKQAIRDANKIALMTALEEARQGVMELARTLAQQFPGHDNEYYYKRIMQAPSKKAKRVISQWCAYLSIRLEKHNEELTTENGDDAPRDRVTKNGLLQEISEDWRAMTPEEKHAVTAAKVKELEERRENRVQAVHNSNISACHDARVTLKHIKTELENLHKRTGTATLLVTTRGSIESFGDPVVHYTDPRVKQFMESTVGATLEDTALRMEAYCVSGVQGVVENQQQRTQMLKNHLSNLILTKLQDAARRANRGEIKRMNYTNFAGAITVKFGIVAENWTTKFENPSGFSHLEVEIALRAWESGTTRFRALTNEEWRAWLEAHFHPQEASSPDAPFTGDSDPSPSSFDAEASTTNTAPSEVVVPSNSNPPTPDSVLNAAPSDPTNGSVESTPTDAEASASAPAAKRARTDGPMSISFINSATPAAGETFAVPKATRKKRSDAGVSRGPRKKPANVVSENVPPAGATPSTTPTAAAPAAQASKSRNRRDKKATATDAAA